MAGEGEGEITIIALIIDMLGHRSSQESTHSPRSERAHAKNKITSSGKEKPEDRDMQQELTLY